MEEAAQGVVRPPRDSPRARPAVGSRTGGAWVRHGGGGTLSSCGAPLVPSGANVSLGPNPQEVEGEQAQGRKLLLRYQAKLLELGAQEEEDLGRFLNQVLKADASLLDVERVSYW